MALLAPTQPFTTGAWMMGSATPLCMDMNSFPSSRTGLGSTKTMISSLWVPELLLVMGKVTLIACRITRKNPLWCNTAILLWGIPPEIVAERNQLFSPPSRYNFFFFFFKLSLWRWNTRSSLGTEEGWVTMALKTQKSLKYLHLRIFSLAGCSASKL